MPLPSDLHPKVAALLADQGIESLYPPQEEAWKAIGQGNVVAAIPTASGKSLIAYLAILHQWLRTGKKALYIVPLRALASEKYEELKAFEALGITVGLATGDPDEKDPRAGRNDVIVCTSEKADALLRHRTEWALDVGCVVADEVHLVNDPSRGPTLEVILSRFHALTDAQIIALSATVGNVDELARWLDARLVQSDWRPVDLRRGTYFGDNLEFEDAPPRHLAAGRDPVTSLVEDAINEGGQCLVFVSTRRSAEAQAQRLGGAVRALLDEAHLSRLKEAAKELGDDLEGSLLQRKLRKMVEAGVAFHTAGLDAKQRRFVEQRFRNGDLKVLCATPTLAAGVNTPARRVIIRDLMRFEVGYGNRPLPIMEVHQMMGRAGRPRYDPYGEAVLLCKSLEMKDAAVEEYLHGEPEDLTSKLAGESALRIHTLASIASGYCDTQEALESWLAGTLWSQQVNDWVIRDRLEEVLWFLEDNGFVDFDNQRYEPTVLGRRTSELYIDPASALRLRQSLQTVGDPTVFGLLEVTSGCPEVYPLYLRKNDDWVQARYYEEYDNRLLPEPVDVEDAMSHAKTACLLLDWINETHQRDVEEKYQIGPGDVRLRVETTNWLLHAYGEFARSFRPEWSRPIQDLALRVQHGVRADALPMLRLKGVGRIRARTLIREGFRTPNDLKGVPLERLARLPGFGDRLARSILRQVGDEPGDAKSTKAEPAESKKRVSLMDFGD